MECHRGGSHGGSIWNRKRTNCKSTEQFQEREASSRGPRRSEWHHHHRRLCPSSHCDRRYVKSIERTLSASAPLCASGTPLQYASPHCPTERSGKKPGLRTSTRGCKRI